MVAELGAEDEISFRHEPLALAELRERPPRHLLHHRHLATAAALGRSLLARREVAPHVQLLPLEVDVGPAQGEQLADPEPGQGAGHVQRRVLLGLRRPRERHHLLVVERLDARAAIRGRSTTVESAGLRASPWTRIARLKIPWRVTRYFWSVRFEILRSATTCPFQRSIICGVTSSTRMPPNVGSAPCCGSPARSSAGRHGPTRRSGGTRPRRPRSAYPSEQRPGRVPRRLIEDVAQPVLGGSLREVAGLRPAAPRPGWSDPLLRLAPVSEAVLRVPDGTALALHAEDVTAHRSPRLRVHRNGGPSPARFAPVAGARRPQVGRQSRRSSGPFWDLFSRAAYRTRLLRICLLEGFSSGPGRTRTCDLRIS